MGQPALLLGLGLAVVVVAWAVLTYNRLVRLRFQADNAWSDIDVQLKKRHDLVPNLVETVKGYAAHERQTLDLVVSARSRALGLEPSVADVLPFGSRVALLTSTNPKPESGCSGPCGAENGNRG